ncbi:phenylalanine--tRNA ligase subunit beta [Candidatus Woesearchaeota archaeon]|nr:phenylalanine--tRNA ligase subunit beta [Candidatus Woesearchaeota archaeon]
MPSITFSADDFWSLIGKKLSEDELRRLLDLAKAELDAALTSEMTVKFNDTNQPYLWSPEGLARFFRAALGKRVLPLKLQKSDIVVNVDKSVAAVRPFIACFLAKGPALSEYLVAQLIQLQEKLAENFGRQRKKVGAGLFPASGMPFPLSYKAVSPDAVSFVPLGMKQELSLKEVLEKHQKGKEYANLLKDAKKYPLVLNGKGEVLTFPPIINSDITGKVKPGDKELLCEVTGTDFEGVMLVSTIFAYALSDRGFAIYPAKVKYGSKSFVTPRVDPSLVKFDQSLVKSLLGLDLSSIEVKHLLERAQYVVKGPGKVELPPYRADVMHSVDVVEDVAIMYGYGDFHALPLTSFTPGGVESLQEFVDLLRVLCVGCGYQELMSAVLSNKQVLYDKMNVRDFGTVEIENIMSQTFSCVRTWLLPVLMDVLSKNRHVDYPQRLFEEGLVTQRGKDVVDERHLAVVSCHAAAGFTEMRQLVESILRSAGVSFSLEEFEMGCFIPGRAARVMVNGREVGFFGEVHPVVLEKFGLSMPVAGCELNLTSLRQQ